MNWLRIIERIAKAYAVFARWVAILSGVAVVILMLYTTADVSGRYLADHPLPAAYELTNILLIYITFFAVTLVQARGGHMRLGFLWEKAGPRGKALIDFVSALIGLFIVGIIVWQSWIWAVESWKIQEITMGAYTVSLVPSRIGLAVGASIFVVQYLIDVLKFGLQLALGKSSSSPTPPKEESPVTAAGEGGAVQ